MNGPPAVAISGRRCTSLWVYVRETGGVRAVRARGESVTGPSLHGVNLFRRFHPVGWMAGGGAVAFGERQVAYTS